MLSAALLGMGLLPNANAEPRNAVSYLRDPHNAHGNAFYFNSLGALDSGRPWESADQSGLQSLVCDSR